MSYFVYIVQCADTTLYTGIACDVNQRLLEHNGEGEKAGAKYTRARRPVRIVYSCEYNNRSEAMKEEYRIKRLSRSEKESLIKSS